MKPIKGNYVIPVIPNKRVNESTWYIVGYSNSLITVSKNNQAVAIRSVKYSSHRTSREWRSDAEPTDETRITILLKGKWEQKFWSREDKGDLTNFTLDQEGDYLIWSLGTWHTWRPLQDSLMLTVSLFQPKLEIMS